MDLRRFKAFTVVVRTRSLTHAAAELGIQQPPLTRMIQQLEAEFGTTLLERLPRGVKPTAAGLALEREALLMLEKAARIPALVRDASNGSTGYLAIGFTSSAALHPVVPESVRAFRARWPKVQMRLEEAGSSELLPALKDQRLQAAFVRSPCVEHPELSATTLLREPMVVAAPNGHRLTGSAVGLSLRSLEGEPLVLYRRPSGPGLYDSILAACVSAGFSPLVVQEAPRLTATLNLVSSGLGLSIIPQSMRRLRSDGIEYCNLTDAQGLEAPLMLVLRSERGQDVDPVIANFRSIVEERLTNI